MTSNSEPEQNLGLIILAAGKGTRMESDLIKVLHPVAGQPVLSYVLEAACQLHPSKIAVVVGFQADLVQKYYQNYNGISWVIQSELKGTGDAVKRTAPCFKDFSSPIMVLCGDIPGIRAETLRRLKIMHDTQGHTITLLTADVEDPTGYGRVVAKADGTITKIVEEKDASSEEREITEINTGIGIYDPQFLFEAVARLQPNNKQSELYLTDLVQDARKLGKSVGRMMLKESLEFMGVNTRMHLADVSRFFFDERASALLERGVSLEDPACIAAEPGVSIGRDSELRGQIGIRQGSKLGRGVKVDSGTMVVSSDLGDECVLEGNVFLDDVELGSRCHIGFGTVIGKSVKAD